MSFLACSILLKALVTSAWLALPSFNTFWPAAMASWYAFCLSSLAWLFAALTVAASFTALCKASLLTLGFSASFCKSLYACCEPYLSNWSIVSAIAAALVTFSEVTLSLRAVNLSMAFFISWSFGYLLDRTWRFLILSSILAWVPLTIFSLFVDTRSFTKSLLTPVGTPPDNTLSIHSEP